MAKITQITPEGSMEHHEDTPSQHGKHKLFTNLTGSWRQAAEFGVVGVMSFVMFCLVGVLSYMVLWIGPSTLDRMQEKFHSELREERTVFREELRLLRVEIMENDARRSRMFEARTNLVVDQLVQNNKILQEYLRQFQKESKQ